jgi:hypothetical protein
VYNRLNARGEADVTVNERFVHIRLSPPFSSWANGQKEIRFPLARGAALTDIVASLTARYPEFGKLCVDDDSTLRERAIFVQDGHVLLLSEEVEMGTVLQVLVPVAGGASSE